VLARVWRPHLDFGSCSPNSGRKRDPHVVDFDFEEVAGAAVRGDEPEADRLAGALQMSEATWLRSGLVSAERRGPIELKGRGTLEVYVVRRADFPG